jgi:hypothetical protein
MKEKVWIYINESSPQHMRKTANTSPSLDSGKTFTNDNTIAITPTSTAKIRDNLVTFVIRVVLPVGMLQQSPQCPSSSYPLLSIIKIVMKKVRSGLISTRQHS